MPLNPDEQAGFAEEVIEIDESTIPMPFQQNIIDELAVPRDERGSGFPGQAWRAVVTPADSARIMAIRDIRFGRAEPTPRHVYFYDADDDKAIEQGNPITFDDSRMYQTVGTGIEAARVPADPIDDGRYYGPTTSEDALSRVGGP